MKRPSRATEWRRRKALREIETCCSHQQGSRSHSWSSSDEDGDQFDAPLPLGRAGRVSHCGTAFSSLRIRTGSPTSADRRTNNSNGNGPEVESLCCNNEAESGDNNENAEEASGSSDPQEDSDQGDDTDNNYVGSEDEPEHRQGGEDHGDDQDEDHGGDPDDDPDDNDNVDEADDNDDVDEAENEEEPDDPDDPDNPDDPDDDPGDESDFNNSSDEDIGNFTFNDALNLQCLSRNVCTIREVVAVILALSCRHSMTYEGIINMCKALNVIHAIPNLPIDKKPLWRLLGRRSVRIHKTVYCPTCLAGHGSLRNLPDVVNCGCGHIIVKRSCKVFISLDIRSQLRELLKRRDIKNALAERNHGDQDGPMKDITDGQQYQLLRNQGNILESNYNFSYNFNTDGFHLTKSSSAEAWPLFLRWNELPWNLRQKYIILAGVWVDLQHPHMNLFLEKFVNQANELSDAGILWEPEPGREVQSKFFPLCCVVDSQARCKMLNLTAPGGYNACPLCNHSGVHVGGSVHYPHLPPVPNPERRTDASIKENMLQATLTGQVVEGFKGTSQLMLLNFFDLGKGVVTDDLHPFSGVIEDHLEILLTPIRGQRQQPDYYIGTQTARIDSRLKTIRTPTHLSRKPRPLKTRKRWQGSEWRNFLLYYLVPVLSGVLPIRYLRHFQLLAQAVYISSRDNVTENDCDEAQELFTEYVHKFERYFGRENMVPNIHILLHVSECIRNWGPIFGQSTTFYESWNHELLKTVTSPHATADQIVTRFFMWRFLSNIDEDEHISDRIKQEVFRLLENPKLRDPVVIDGIHLLGKATVRQPTPRELLLLNMHNVCAINLVEYKRAYYNGVEFRSRGYRYAGDETKSDNSQVYTWGDEFGEIIAVVAVGDVHNRRVVIFLKIHDTDAFVNRYLCKVREDGNNIIVLKFFPDIRSMSIKCSNASGTYVMPVANSKELD